MSNHNDHKKTQASERAEHNTEFPFRTNPNPFQVPEHYFEDLKRRTGIRIASNEVPVSVYRQVMKPVVRYIVPLAAAAALILLLITVFRTPGPAEDDFKELTLEQLLEGNPDFVLSFDEEEFIEILLASEFSEAIDFNTLPELDTGIQEEVLIDYLLESELTTESFYN